MSLRIGDQVALAVAFDSSNTHGPSGYNNFLPMGAKGVISRLLGGETYGMTVWMPDQILRWVAVTREQVHLLTTYEIINRDSGECVSWNLTVDDVLRFLQYYLTYYRSGSWSPDGWILLRMNGSEGFIVAADEGLMEWVMHEQEKQ